MTMKRLHFTAPLSLLALMCTVGNTTFAAQQSASIQAPTHKVIGLNKANRVENQYYVVFNESVSKLTKRQSFGKSLALKHNGKVLRTLKNLPMAVMEMSELSAIALSRDPNVAFVQARGDVKFGTTQTIPSNSVGSSYISQWGMDRIDQRYLPMNDKYTYEGDGKGVHLYIVDSGINRTTGEFNGRLGAKHVVDGGEKNGSPCNPHGTRVANMAASTTYGIAKGATVYDVNVNNCDNGSIDTVSGLDHVISDVISNNRYPAVVNMSIWSTGESPAMELAVQRVLDKGITFVGIAGNDSINDCGSSSPAGVNNAIITGSSTDDDDKADHSNFGSCVDLFAPGDRLMLESHYGSGGTSFAAPHVAGVAARYLERKPTASPVTVKNALLSNATNNVLGGIGSGSPNKLLYSGFLEQMGNVLYGTSGRDTVYANGGNLGTGTPYDDTVYGYGGNDIIYVQGGADNIFGGDGNDEIGGGSGNDILHGEAGNDVIFGGSGNDTLVGGPGSDTLYGGSGSDTIISLTDNTFDGDEFNHVIDNRDEIYGGSGDDTIVLSSNSNAYVSGDEGNDTYVIKFTPQKLKAPAGSLEIVDTQGNNQLVFDNLGQDQLTFKAAGGQLNIYHRQSGVKLLTIPSQSMTSYRFKDITVSQQRLTVVSR